MGASNQRQLRAAFFLVAPSLVMAIVFGAVCRQFFSAQSTAAAQSLGRASASPAKAAKTAAKTAMASPPSKALVVASTSEQPVDEVAWLADVGADWHVFHYVTDAPLHPDLAVPVAKGAEAMAYLTFIVDHYERLPDVVLFRRGHRRAWHQAMDSLDEVRLLRPAYVVRAGYASTRCLAGCENVLPLADQRQQQLASLLGRFLGGGGDDDVALPPAIAAPCCAQFAASRDAIRRRSRAWWRRLRQWLIDTPLPDRQSGRLMEQTWHIWLGNESYQ